MAEPTSQAPTEKLRSEVSDSKESSSKARLASGVVFLRAADKRKTTLSFRINFLKSKGFSADEIFQCFEAAGQPQPMETVLKMFEEVPSKSSQRALPTSSHNTLHNSPYFAPLPPPPTEGFTWKDGFIAATLGSLIGYGAYKAASSWLPWEVVLKRKESGDEPRRKKKRERVRDLAAMNDELKLIDAPAAVEVQLESQSKAHTSQTALAGAHAEEIKALRVDLAEKSEQYTKAMREKAELTIKASQVKAQQAQSARAIENANKKIADLELQLKEALEKLNPPPPSEKGLENPYANEDDVKHESVAGSTQEAEASVSEPTTAVPPSSE